MFKKNKRSNIMFIVHLLIVILYILTIFAFILMRANYINTIDALQLEIANYMGDIDNLQVKLTSYENTINDLQVKIIDYESQINKLNDDIKTLNEEIAKYKKDLVKNLNVNDTFNPHSKSNLSVADLDKMLNDTGLKSCGTDFYEMEQTYNVNALFAMGVAMHESANGYHLANTNNYFGFRNNNGWMSFNSKRDCIMYFGKLISTKYNDRHTIADIQSKYCTSTIWGIRVKNHMNTLKNKLL